MQGKPAPQVGDRQIAGLQRPKLPGRPSAGPTEAMDSLRDHIPFPQETLIGRAAALFGLLANETRLKLLLALHPRIEPLELRELTSRCVHDEPDDLISNRELCVCDLAMVAGASPSMTSHQLHLLRRARLVEFRRAGKHALYRLSDGPHAHLLLDALEYVRMAKLTTCDSGVESDG